MLIDQKGNMRLCDFGLTKFAEIQTVASTQNGGVAGSIRWKAPEIMYTDDESSGRNTYATDVYAFGMTILEVGCQLFLFISMTEWAVTGFLWEDPFSLFPKRWRCFDGRRIGKTTRAASGYPSANIRCLVVLD